MFCGSVLRVWIKRKSSLVSRASPVRCRCIRSLEQPEKSGIIGQIWFSSPLLNASANQQAYKAENNSHWTHARVCVVIIYANAQTVSSEVLRRYGLSLLHSHIVLLTRTRAGPLEAPSPPAPVPQWKLFRMPRKAVITDEPKSACEWRNWH